MSRPTSIGFFAIVTIALAHCGDPGAELQVDDSVVSHNMLTGESCQPDPATFVDHGGKDARGGEDAQFCAGDECQGVQQQEQQGEPQGEQHGEPQGEPQGEQNGEPQGEPPGEQQECHGECDGTQTQQRERTREGLRCGEGYYHADDFPQPGCDQEGCCQIRAEDAEWVQTRERIRCRCRARFQGEVDTSSLPECCADRPERQCEPDAEPPAGEDPA